MRTIRWGLLAALLAACGGSPSTSRSDAGSPSKHDAAVWPGTDAGAPSADAAVISRRDAGSIATADAGGTAADGGVLTCKLEPPEQAVRLTGQGELHELADLTFGDGRLAVAYSWNQSYRKLAVVDTGGTLLSDETMGTIDGSTVPRAIDYADGVYFVAGNFDDSTSPLYPYTRLAFFDGTGVAKEWAQHDGFLSIAAAREASGGRTLALAKALATGEQQVFVNRYGLEGELLDSTELGRNGRKYNDWDLEWRHADDTGVACGLVSAEGQDTLAIWPMAADAALEPVKTALAIPGATDQATFGCRLSLGQDMAAVAVADGVEGARLVWLGKDGSTLAGPVPFSTFKRAARYDVSVSGTATALAHLDDSSGTPRVAIKIFRTPADAPLELSAEEGLGLGAFDLVGRRVRLARIDGGFAVAFDANIKLGQTDLYVRRIVCQ
ncbi:MAG: hypothetical protein QM765_12960 [Myxococcales bacterium]